MTDREKELGEALFTLGRHVLSQDVERRDGPGGDLNAWRPLWDAAAEAGVLGLVLPENLGGAGLPLLSAIRLLHRLGEGCRDNGMLLAINGQLWAMQMSIFEFGSEAQRNRWLPKMIDGSLTCAHAVTEEHSGSDAMSMQTRAERIDGGYRLTGKKVWIGMAPAADMAQVFAVTEPAHGGWGLSTFLVDLNAPGVTRSAPYHKVGHRTVPAGEIDFDGVEVPQEARLGAEGMGRTIFLRSIDWERRFIFASHVGAMKRQLDEAVSYARKRAPGGTPVSRHQSVSNRLADMRVRYETSRLLIEAAAREIDEAKEKRATPAVTKLHVAEAMLANAEDAMRIFASAAYRSGETERMFRDAAGAVTLGGSSDIQRQIIAALESG